MTGRSLITALFACLALGGCAKSPPEVVFNTLGGERIELTSLRGSPVIVNFWSVTCALCLRDMPKLVALHQEMADVGVQVFGVSMDFDPPHLVVERVRGSNVSYPVSLDLRGEIAASFGGVQATPTTIVLDSNGEVVARYTGSLDFSALRNTIRSLI